MKEKILSKRELNLKKVSREYLGGLKKNGSDSLTFLGKTTCGVVTRDPAIG